MGAGGVGGTHLACPWVLYPELLPHLPLTLASPFRRGRRILSPSHRANEGPKGEKPAAYARWKGTRVLSSCVYKREEVFASLLAQQLEFSFDLMICNQRTLVLRLPHPAGVGLPGKGIFGATSAVEDVNHAQSRESCLFFLSPFQTAPGSPSGNRQELGCRSICRGTASQQAWSRRSNGKYVVTLTPVHTYSVPNTWHVQKQPNTHTCGFFLLTVSVGNPHVDFSPLP